MLLEFKVKNYKSIKDWQSFSLLAEGSINELKDNVVNIESFNVLTTSLIYGRNASGKSNLLNAIRTFQHLIFESSNFKVDKIISLYEPYKLDESFSNKPTEFQIDFLAKNNVRYIYEIGFSKYEIVYEILKFYPKNHPATLFERKKGFKIKYGEYFTGRKKDIEDKLYKNQLFLSKTATNKLNTLIPAYKFLSNGLFVYSFHDSSFDDMLTRVYTNRIADDKVERS
jgi:AAA15 family ATPase/GTPase